MNIYLGFAVVVLTICCTTPALATSGAMRQKSDRTSTRVALAQSDEPSDESIDHRSNGSEPSLPATGRVHSATNVGGRTNGNRTRAERTPKLTYQPSEPYLHDGLYVSGALHTTGLLSFSGTEQTRTLGGVGALGPSIEFGGTSGSTVFGVLWQYSRVSWLWARDPVNLRQPLEEPGDIELEAYHFGPFFSHYIDPHEGWHFGGSLGYTSLGAAFRDNAATGLGIALDVGYDEWTGAQWSAGPFVRFTGNVMSIDEGALGEADVDTLMLIVGVAARHH